MEKLIESDQHEDEEPAEAEPRPADRNTDSGNSNWALHAVLVLVAVGLIVGLIFLARWIYHETKSTTNNNPPSSQSAGNNSGKSSSSNNPLTVNNGSQSNNGQKSSASNSASNNGQSLPNNGPGNVIGIFVAASFAAGALHYIASLRKASKEN